MIINPTLPFGHVTFCDDVRYELNGKSTLVGIYGTEMRLFGEAPLLLPELHVMVALNVSAEKTPLKGQFRIIKSGSEQIICEQNFEIPDCSSVDDEVTVHPESQQLSFVGLNTHLIIRNFSIDEVCRLKVRAFIGKDEIRIGSLHISFAPTSEIQLPS